MNIIQQFLQFKNSFHGDAREQIQRMLNNGQISQAQYNAAVQQAQQLQGIIKASAQGFDINKIQGGL